MNKEIVELQVEGMDCSNCAQSITRFLERKGLEDVFVNFQTKEVRFARNDAKLDLEAAKAGIRKLGYTVVEPDDPTARSGWTLSRKLLISAVFTLPLLLGHVVMVFGWHTPLMHNGWLQLALATPVFLIGLRHFGGSAWAGLRGGVANMDVLIFLGSTAAFIYSLLGLYFNNPDYYFFETAATIITLVLLGNYLEHRAVAQTTTAIGELTQLQPQRANRVMPSGTIVSVEREEIQPGYLLQVNEGDQVPADGVILSGSADIDESMLTGESLPVSKQSGERVIGASVVADGNFQMRVEAAGKDTVLSQMIELVKTAQADKPPIQQLADRISAIFVPVVVGISLLTLILGYFAFGLPFTEALLRAIAVLVISCPCAMGLATPTAVMVGVGRLARNGILVRGGRSLEALAGIRKVLFDKTGTLTTGQFRIKDIRYPTGEEQLANDLLYHLEQRSSHPIAKSIVAALADRSNGLSLEDWQVSEERGRGLTAVDPAGQQYQLGSANLLPQAGTDAEVVLLREGDILATLRLEDDIKPEAAETIAYLQRNDIEPILLSGDKQQKVAEVAKSLGIERFYAEQLPEQKLSLVETFSHQEPTAMVGDGINDAPALARANLGISLSGASQAAIQSAQFVLLKDRLDGIRKALGISKATVTTIRQNLFWAFSYNIVAIPLAILGYLNPMWAAFFMAFSDVVVIGNSIRLKYRRISESE